MDSAASGSGETKRLAARAIKIEYAALDRQTIDRAKLLLLDHLGCALIGSTMPWTEIIFRYVSSFGGNPEARVVNHGNRIATHDAACINAVFAQGSEWDDNSTRGMGPGHAGAATWPAVLAVGQRRHSSGKDILAAGVAGYEVMARIAKAVRPSSDHRGWHPLGIFAPFAAATASSWLLHLSEDQMVTALSIAASRCAGTNEFHHSGGEIKRLFPGNGVAGGVQAAFLSQMGLTAPPTILEGELGFCRAYASEFDLDELVKPSDLFAVMESDTKVFPSGGLSASSIENMAELRERYGFTHEQIEKLEVSVSAKAAARNGPLQPSDLTGAQFSVPYSIALRAVIGRNDLPDYMESSLWTDQRLANICKRISFKIAPEAVGDERHFGRLVVVLKDGSRFETFRPYPKGSFLNPQSESEIKGKFLRIATRILGEARAAVIIETIDRIEKLEDANKLVDLVCKGS